MNENDLNKKTWLAERLNSRFPDLGFRPIYDAIDKKITTKQHSRFVAMLINEDVNLRTELENLI